MTTIIMTAIRITFGLVGCWCLMAHNIGITTVSMVVIKC